MKNGLVISDSGPIFSLAVIGEMRILEALFDEVYIPRAVWEELTRDKTTDFYPDIVEFFATKVREIAGFNELTFVMDYGESEAIILYRELEANYLLIDDKKARSIAENFDIQCIGTIGLLAIAKGRGIINELRPLFLILLKKKRFYSLDLLNAILKKYGEAEIKI